MLGDTTDVMKTNHRQPLMEGAGVMERMGVSPPRRAKRAVSWRAKRAL